MIMDYMRIRHLFVKFFERKSKERILMAQRYWNSYSSGTIGYAYGDLYFSFAKVYEELANAFK